MFVAQARGGSGDLNQPVLHHHRCSDAIEQSDIQVLSLAGALAVEQCQQNALARV
jgi:hypothetical protein